MRTEYLHRLTRHAVPRLEEEESLCSRCKMEFQRRGTGVRHLNPTLTPSETA